MKKTILALAVAGLALAEPQQPIQFYMQHQQPKQRLRKDRFKYHKKGKR